MVESDGTETAPASDERKSLDSERVRRLAASAFASVVLAAILGSTLLLLERRGVDIPTVAEVLLTVLSILLGFGGLLAFGYAFFTLIPKNAGGRGRESKLDRSAETERLNAPPEALSLPSVTENTTDILPARIAVPQGEGERTGADDKGAN